MAPAKAKNWTEKFNGKLEEHESACYECGGEGVIYGPETNEDDEDAAGETCVECDGVGTFSWGSWYGEDVGECPECGEEILIGRFDDDWICLACYLRQHREYCGCGLWKEVETEVLETTG